MSFEYIINKQKYIYGQNFSENKSGPNATFNQSESRQLLRYANLFSWLSLPRKTLSVFDVGCGVGELYDWLGSHVQHLSYYGSEVVPEMVCEANLRVPSGTVYELDILSKENLPTADVYCMSGVLNFHGGVGEQEWLEYSQEMILRMYNASTIGVCFNGLSTAADFYNKDMFYSSPAKWLDYLSANCSRFVGIKSDYALFEFSAYALKPEWVASQTDDELARYIKIENCR